MNPLINIITRTSNRPKCFKRNVESIKKQTYRNYKHIVSYDTIEDYESYLNEYDDIDLYYINKEEIIKNYRGIIINNPSFWPSPHNLYCNICMDKVVDGWVIFLDDDDFLIDEYSLEKISKLINDPDELVIWQMEYNNGRKIPSDNSINNKNIFLGDISSQCFAFHSKWINSCSWDGYKCADYRFIDCLSKKIKNIKFVNETFVKVPTAGFGKRNDMI